MWTAIGLVTGSFSLIAFVVATAYWAYRRSLLGTEALVSSVPEAERGRLLEDFLQSVHVDTTDLTKEQRYLLAHELIASRAKANQQRSLLVAFLGLIAGIVAMLALLYGRAADATDQGGSSLPSSPPVATEAQGNTATPAPERQLLLTGEVRSEATGDPIEGATLTATMDSLSQNSTTNSYGRFTFRFKTAEPELVVQIEASSEGYKVARETVILQNGTLVSNLTLRSIATDRLKQLAGHWQASLNDEDVEMHVRLDLASASPTQLVGTFGVLFALNAESFQPAFGQPSGPPPECRLEARATLGFASGDLWMNLANGRRISQTGQGFSCDVAAMRPSFKVRQPSSDRIVIDDFDGQPLVFVRVGI